MSSATVEPDDPPPAINLEGLTKTFDGDVTAVDDVDLTVPSGAVFGFLGPNGAGKTTAINLLLDLIRPTAGTAEIFGMDCRDSAKAIRKRVGVLPEKYTLYDRLSGREHLDWAIEEMDASDDPAEILNLVGLGEDGHRSAGDYSKGMQQRLTFAMAIVGDPDLLILDEPTTGLDPNGLQQVRETILERAEDGTTVFFSTHILSEIEAVCDRVGIMNEGRLVATDSVERLRKTVATEATIEVTCESVPETDPIQAVEGVHAVDVEDRTVTAYCDSPGVKYDVVTSVGEQTDVQDIVSERTSLERVFNEHVTSGGDGASDDGDGAPNDGDGAPKPGDISRDAAQGPASAGEER